MVIANILNNIKDKMNYTKEYMLNTLQLNKLLGNIIDEHNIPEMQSTMYVRGLHATRYDTIGAINQSTNWQSQKLDAVIALGTNKGTYVITVLFNELYMLPDVVEQFYLENDKDITLVLSNHKLLRTYPSNASADSIKKWQIIAKDINYAFVTHEEKAIVIGRCLSKLLRTKTHVPDFGHPCMTPVEALALVIAIEDPDAILLSIAGSTTINNIKLVNAHTELFGSCTNKWKNRNITEVKLYTTEHFSPFVSIMWAAGNKKKIPDSELQARNELLSSFRQTVLNNNYLQEIVSEHRKPYSHIRDKMDKISPPVLYEGINYSNVGICVNDSMNIASRYYKVQDPVTIYRQMVTDERITSENPYYNVISIADGNHWKTSREIQLRRPVRDMIKSQKAQRYDSATINIGLAVPSVVTVPSVSLSVPVRAIKGTLLDILSRTSKLDRKISTILDIMDTDGSRPVGYFPDESALPDITTMAKDILDYEYYSSELDQYKVLFFRCTRGATDGRVIQMRWELNIESRLSEFVVDAVIDNIPIELMQKNGNTNYAAVSCVGSRIYIHEFGASSSEAGIPTGVLFFDKQDNLPAKNVGIEEDIESTVSMGQAAVDMVYGKPMAENMKKGYKKSLGLRASVEQMVAIHLTRKSTIEGLRLCVNQESRAREQNSDIINYSIGRVELSKATYSLKCIPRGQADNEADVLVITSSLRRNASNAILWF